MAQFNKHFLAVSSISRARLVNVFKWLVSFATIAYLYRYLTDDGKSFASVIQAVIQKLILENAFLLFLILILVPLNWALESWKWHRLVNKIIPLSFKEAVNGTLVGLVGGVILPAQIGEVVGRISSINSSIRKQALGASIVSSGIQYYLSLVMGWIGLLAIRSKLELTNEVFIGLNFSFFFLIVIAVLAYSYRKNSAESLGWFKRFYLYFAVIGMYSNSDFGKATFIGFLRYLTYVIQFFLALILFDIELPLPTLSAIVTVLLLIKTIIPTLNFLGDWGIRGISAVYLFDSFSIASDRVLAVSFLIWIVNLLLPILIGLGVIWTIKVKVND